MIATIEPVKGSGTFILPNGGRYEGEWQKFEGDILKRHGHGTYAEGEDGKYGYEGNWDNDVMSGHGVFKYPSGAVYDGSWVNNEYHGPGKYTWPDGSFYQGDWVHNRMHGVGVYRDKNSEQWKGSFFNNTGPGLTTWYR